MNTKVTLWVSILALSLSSTTFSTPTGLYWPGEEEENHATSTEECGCEEIQDISDETICDDTITEPSSSEDETELFVEDYSVEEDTTESLQAVAPDKCEEDMIPLNIAEDKPTGLTPEQQKELDDYEAQVMQEALSDQQFEKVIQPPVATEAHPENASRPESSYVIKCPLCLEEFPREKTTTLSCCNARYCLECTKTLFSKLDEEKDEAGSQHPKEITYAKEMSAEAFNKTLEYQNATPQNHPQWSWYRIKNKDYFLKDASLWRYEKSQNSDKKPNSNGWRLIRAPRCPEMACNKVCLPKIEHLKIT